MSSLEGKVAIVTGGSRGLGRAIAAALVRAGVNVMITGRNADTLRQAASDLGPGVMGFVGDSGTFMAAEKCVGRTIELFGGLDILVNNAGGIPYQGPMIQIPYDLYRATMAVNLEGPLHHIQACWDGWMALHGGVVVNVSSIRAEASGGGPYGCYGMAKSALNYLTRHVAVELAPNVRVNAIAPGLIPTDLVLETRGLSDIALPPIGRLGLPMDIANAALFLASDAASWVTGQVLVVDGGASLRDATSARTGPGAGEVDQV